MVLGETRIWCSRQGMSVLIPISSTGYTEVEITTDDLPHHNGEPKLDTAVNETSLFDSGSKHVPKFLPKHGKRGSVTSEIARFLCIG